MEEMIQQDKELFLELNNLGCYHWDMFWYYVTQTWTWIPLYIILFYLLWKKIGTRNLLWAIPFIILLILVSDQLSNTFKEGFERLRPCRDTSISGNFRYVLGKCKGNYGFFSAHSSNAFSIVMFITLIFRNRWTILLFFWATIVAYSRIYVGAHFPLDVIVGAIVGLLNGVLFYFLFQKFILSQNNTNAHQVLF